MNLLLRYFSEFLSDSNMSCDIIKCGTFNTDRLVLMNQQIPLKDEYKYLGVMFSKFGVDQEKLLELIQRKINLHFNCAPRFGFSNYGYSLYNCGIYFKTFLRSTIEYYICLLNLKNFKKIKSLLYSHIKRYFQTKSTISCNKALNLLCEPFETRYNNQRSKIYNKLNEFIDESNSHSRNLLHSFQMITQKSHHFWASAY
eukprot:NODE_422_length_7706_cov_0.257229.p5 type:complete len:199 gc:universal NODE_422_length_7706_cov_0.257229:3704-4300(+)